MLKFLGLFPLLVAFANGANDFCLLPDLPKSYVTTVQMNVGPSPFDEHGYSRTFTEYVDGPGHRVRIDMVEEINPNNGNPPNVFYESVIWNPSVDGKVKFLDFKRDYYGNWDCIADDISQSRWELQFLFGYDPDHPDALPGLTQILHFGNKNNYTCAIADPTDTDGIISEAFSTHFVNDNLGIFANLTYYWSNKISWHSTSGTNVSTPVKADMRGHIKINGNEEDKEVEFIFSNFMEPYFNAQVFTTPNPKLQCRGRTQDVNPGRSMPPAFQYNSEVQAVYKTQDGSYLEVIEPRKEFYNFNTQMSRTDYKPIDINATAHGKPYSLPGIMSEIKDFTAGISYTINSETYDCHTHDILFDFSGPGDVIQDPDGSIHMANPADMWGMNTTFNSNGVIKLRGIDTQVLITEIQQGSNGSYANYTHVLYLASYAWSEDTGDQLEKSVPLRVEIYPTDDYGSPEKWVTYNVEGFTIAPPNFEVFDITPCFTPTQMAHKQILLDWNPAMDVPGVKKQIYDQIRSTAAILAKITPLRIQNIELDVVPMYQSMYVTFTIVDKPHLDHVSHEMPPTASLPLADAVTNLKNGIKDGLFHISVKENNGGGTLTSTANKDYFFDTDRTPVDPPNGGGGNKPNGNDSNKSSGTRYSGGAMAGLAFGMIFLGLALSTVLYFFVLKRFLPPRIPYTQGIENPVHFSANSAE